MAASHPLEYFAQMAREMGVFREGFMEQLENYIMTEGRVGMERQKQEIFSDPRGPLVRVTEFFQKMKRSVQGTPLAFDALIYLQERLFSRKLDLVEIRPSSVHGRGVFAKKDIPKGTLVTFYPGDMVEHLEKSKVAGDKTEYAVTTTSDSLTKKASTTEGMNYLTRYKVTVSKDYAIIGDPENISDPTYLGHMINDAARSHNPDDMIIYLVVAASKMNVAIMPIEDCHVGVVALRDIKRHEELFFPYGPDYWKSYYE